MISAVAQLGVGRFAAQVLGNLVVEERVGRGHGVVVAAELLDGLGRAAALPHADQPQRVEPTAGQRGQLFVGNLVEAADMPPVLLAQLRQPHIGALGDQHRVGHPRRVGTELLVLMSRIAEYRHFGMADDGGPLLATALATPRRSRSGRFSRSGLRLRVRRVVHGPDRQLFLVQNLPCEQQKALNAVAQQRLPQPANQFQLLAERGGRIQGRFAQQIEKCDRLAVVQRHQRPSGKVGRQLPRHLAVNGLLRQRLLFKKLLERPESFIPIGCPQQQQFFQRGCPVRHAVRRPGQPLQRRLVAPHHARSGKMLDKGQQQGVQRRRRHLCAKPIQGAGHHLGVELLAVLRHDHVAGLVDEAHRKKLAGVHRLLRVPGGVAHLIDAQRKLPACRHVCEDNIARIGEERLRKLVAFPCISRNMEFHHKRTSSKTRSASKNAKKRNWGGAAALIVFTRCARG